MNSETIVSTLDFASPKRKRKRSVKQVLVLWAQQGQFQAGYIDSKGNYCKKWVSQETVDRTIYFGSSDSLGIPKVFRNPDDLGSLLCSAKGDSLPDPVMIIRMLEFLGYDDFAESWSQFEGTDEAKEALVLMTKLVSAKLYNGKHVRSRYKSERTMEAELLARL